MNKKQAISFLSLFFMVSLIMLAQQKVEKRSDRGKIRKAGVSPFHPLIIEGQYHVPSRGWAEMIRQFKSKGNNTDHRIPEKKNLLRRK